MKIDVIDKKIGDIDKNNRAHITYNLQFWDKNNNPMENQPVQVYEENVLLYDTDTNLEGQASFEVIIDIIKETRKTLNFIVGNETRTKVFVLDTGDKKIRSAFPTINADNSEKAENYDYIEKRSNRMIRIKDSKESILLKNGCYSNFYEKLEIQKGKIIAHNNGLKAILYENGNMSDWHQQIVVEDDELTIIHRYTPNSISYAVLFEDGSISDFYKLIYRKRDKTIFTNHNDQKAILYKDQTTSDWYNIIDVETYPMEVWRDTSTHKRALLYNDKSISSWHDSLEKITSHDVIRGIRFGDREIFSKKFTVIYKDQSESGEYGDILFQPNKTIIGVKYIISPTGKLVGKEKYDITK
jgi:hypothetical protein